MEVVVTKLMVSSMCEGCGNKAYDELRGGCGNKAYGEQYMWRLL